MNLGDEVRQIFRCIEQVRRLLVQGSNPFQHKYRQGSRQKGRRGTKKTAVYSLSLISPPQITSQSMDSWHAYVFSFFSQIPLRTLDPSLNIWLCLSQGSCGKEFHAVSLQYEQLRRRALGAHSVEGYPEAAELVVRLATRGIMGKCNTSRRATIMVVRRLPTTWQRSMIHEIQPIIDRVESFQPWYVLKYIENKYVNKYVWACSCQQRQCCLSKLLDALIRISKTTWPV